MSGKGAFFTPGKKPLFPFFRKKEEAAPSVSEAETGGPDDNAASSSPSGELEPLAQGSPMDWSNPSSFPHGQQAPDADQGLPQGWGASSAASPIQAAGSSSSSQKDEVPMAWIPPGSQAPLSWPGNLAPSEPSFAPPTVKAEPLPQEAMLRAFSPMEFADDPDSWAESQEAPAATAASFLHVEKGQSSDQFGSHPHFEVVEGGSEESVLTPPPLPSFIETSADPAPATEVDSDWLARAASEWEPGPLRPIEDEADDEVDAMEEEPPAPSQSFTWDSILGERVHPSSPAQEARPSDSPQEAAQASGVEFQPPAPAWGAPAWGWPSYAKDEFPSQATRAEEPPVTSLKDGDGSGSGPDLAAEEASAWSDPAPWQEVDEVPRAASVGDPHSFRPLEPEARDEAAPQAWPTPGEPSRLMPPPLPTQDMNLEEVKEGPDSAGTFQWPELGMDAPSEDEVLAHVWRREDEPFGGSGSATGLPVPGDSNPDPEEQEIEAAQESQPWTYADDAVMVFDRGGIVPPPLPSLEPLSRAVGESGTAEALQSAPVSNADAAMEAFDRGEYASVPESKTQENPLEEERQVGAEFQSPSPFGSHEEDLLAFDRGEATDSQAQTPRVVEEPRVFQEAKPSSDHEAALLAFDRGEVAPAPERTAREVESPADSQEVKPSFDHHAALLAFDRGEVTPPAVPTPRLDEAPPLSQEAKPLSDHEAALAAFDRGEAIASSAQSTDPAVAWRMGKAPSHEQVLGSAHSWSDSTEWMQSSPKPDTAAVTEMIWVDEAPSTPPEVKATQRTPEALFEANFEKSIERLFSQNRDFRWKKVGELLQELGLVSDADLAEALSLQAVSKKPLGRILVEQGIISDRLLLKVLAAQKDVVPCFLDTPLEPDLLSLLEPEFCLRCQVLPVSQKANVLTLAMRNPSDVDTIDFVAQATGLAVEPGLADEELLAKKIEEAYARDARSHRAHVDALVQEAIKTSDIRVVSIDESKSVQAIEEETRPVSAIVQKLLTEGVKMRASDIHMEPTLRDLQIRYRIDGRLHKVNSVPKELQPMILARVKILAELDPVEWRIPQDGRISFECEGKVIDLRVSVLPSFYGGRVVMRILDRSIGLKNLEDIGFSDSNLGIFRTLIKRPYGLFLVTGPTGSGKTTSLYAALNEVKDDETNIITCEDPVEYNLEGISQSQVNSKIGLTFAAQLRSILRQDPDVVLVGEIRDHETAETAIRASMTGHLVFSTLHCNDAPSAIPRLLDMNIDPYLLSTSLIGVMGQRLLRRICPECMHDYSPSEDERTILERTFGLKGVDKLYKGKGCVRCAHTGFKGRFAVHEIMPVTHEISSFIAERSATEKLAEVSRFYGYRTMQEDAMERVLRGQTSLKEAQRLLAFDDIPKMDPAAGKLQG